MSAMHTSTKQTLPEIYMSSTVEYVSIHVTLPPMAPRYKCGPHFPSVIGAPNDLPPVERRLQAQVSQYIMRYIGVTRLALHKHV